MPSKKKSLRAALIVGAVATLVVTPLAPAAAASGGGCDGWTYFTEYNRDAKDTNGKGCISYSDEGFVKPDAYVNFHFRNPGRVGYCMASTLVYSKVGRESVRQDSVSRVVDCRDEAQSNAKGVRYPAGMFRASSGEYWTVFKVQVRYGNAYLNIHSGSPHVKP